MVVRTESKQFSNIFNMKKLILIFFPLIASGQVGINTKTPTQTLDVNGTLRVRNLPNGAQNDSIVVVRNGVFKKVALTALQAPFNCPQLVKNQSNGFYLLFKSNGSVPNPNNAIQVNGVNWVAAGSWIDQNMYFYSWTNVSGVPVNINSFTVNFSGNSCTY